jgi:hypothetical protein
MLWSEALELVGLINQNLHSHFVLTLTLILHLGCFVQKCENEYECE